MLVALDWLAKEPLLKHVSDMAGASIEIARISGKKTVHGFAQTSVIILQEQMNMIVHQAPSQNRNSMLHHDVSKHRAEPLSVVIILEDYLPSISTRDNMVQTGL